MNEYIVYGLIFGLMIGLLMVAIILKVTKNNNKFKCEFDERQAALQGIGYKYAFFTLVVYCFLYGCFEVAIERSLMEPIVAMTIGICIAIAVQISYCIWKDAYFAMNENRDRLMVCFVIIAFVNLVLGIMSFVEGSAIENGMLTFRACNLICGILFIEIFTVLLLKKITTKTQEEV